MSKSLVLEAVCKNFGGVVAAQDVHMEVPAGRVTGLIGPNGAGKTTLVNLITGMLPLSSGSIRFGADETSQLSAHEISRLGFARTFQNIRLLKEATVLENLLIGFHQRETSAFLSCLLGLASSRRETRRTTEEAMALLQRFDMSRFADYPASGLAYGHQRRVEMMRAVASQPALLMLDEPVAGMNDVEAQELGSIFKTLSQQGMGILLIEHNIRFVTQMCEYIYVLDGGRIIAQGTPEQVVANPAVIAAYLGS
jgi:branched-chain amino acid transport system ATP-binding protein